MAKKVKKSKSPKVYEFTVSLEGITPVVWRKFLIHEFIELSELHMLIQMTMGWEAKHLYMFEINGLSYSDLETAEEQDVNDAEGTLLCDVIGSSKEFSYTYDFGDDWRHKVEVTAELEHDPRINYPICIGGENACPPEDCGGIHGFHKLKKVLRGKDSEEKDNIIEWLGGFYDPTSFDPNFVNKHMLWGDLYFDEMEF